MCVCVCGCEWSMGKQSRNKTVTHFMSHSHSNGRRWLSLQPPTFRTLFFLFFGLYFSSFFSFFSSFFGFYYLCSASSQRNIFSVLPCIYHRTRVNARVIVTQWLRWQKYGSDKVISSNCKVFFLVFCSLCVCKCFALVATCHRSILCSLEKRHKHVYESPMYISTFPLLLKRDNVFFVRCLCVSV